MDWLQVAKNDWEIYHSTNRIQNFVLKGKITPEEYEQITGEPYSA